MRASRLAFRSPLSLAACSCKDLIFASVSCLLASILAWISSCVACSLALAASTFAWSFARGLPGCLVTFGFQLGKVGLERRNVPLDLGVQEFSTCAAEDDAAQGLHARIDRQRPLLPNFGYDGGLARQQGLFDLG